MFASNSCCEIVFSVPWKRFEVALMNIPSATGSVTIGFVVVICFVVTTGAVAGSPEATPGAIDELVPNAVCVL